jgi:hypothetical protein
MDDASVRTNFIELKHEIREFPETPTTNQPISTLFSGIYEWHPACVDNRASCRDLLYGGEAMPMTFKIERLVRGEHFSAQARRADFVVLSNGQTLITAYLVDRPPSLPGMSDST